MQAVSGSSIPDCTPEQHMLPGLPDHGQMCHTQWTPGPEAGGCGGRRAWGTGSSLVTCFGQSAVHTLGNPEVHLLVSVMHKP